MFSVKRVCTAVAVAMMLALAGGIAWYVMSGFQKTSYEEQGTLVYQPAFVTRPVAVIYGENEIVRSGSGL